MNETLIRGKYVICKITGPDSADVVSDGAVFQRDGAIIDVGKYEDLRASHPNVEVIGSSQHLVMPGLVNDHVHVGLTPCQLGALDNNQEIRALCRLGSRRIAPYLDHLYGATQMIETGTTTAQAMPGGHRQYPPSEMIEMADEVLSAYRRVGMRVAYSPNIQDRNAQVVGARGDEKQFAAYLPDDLRDRCALLMGRGYGAVEDWMSGLEAIAVKYGSGQYPTVQLTLAPSNVHRCSDDLLMAIKEMAQRHKTITHIHLQESPYQKLFGLRAWGKTPLQHLNDLGYLGPDLVCSHGVWVTDEDIDLLAATKTTICHNPSSNLRVHNGIAPMAKLLQRGIRIALGADEATINDDKDMFLEMRLALRLQYLPGIENVAPTAHQVFQMATEHGAYAAGFRDRVGTLEPGKRADIVVLSLRNIEHPYLDPGVSIIDALVYRGRSQDVETVLIDGDVVMSDGRLTHVDRDALFREINKELERPLELDVMEARKLIAEIEPYMRSFLEGTFPASVIPHSVYNATS